MNNTHKISKPTNTKSTNTKAASTKRNSTADFKDRQMTTTSFETKKRTIQAACITISSCQPILPTADPGSRKLTPSHKDIKMALNNLAALADDNDATIQSLLVKSLGEILCTNSTTPKTLKSIFDIFRYILGSSSFLDTTHYTVHLAAFTRCFDIIVFQENYSNANKYLCVQCTDLIDTFFQKCKDDVKLEFLNNYLRYFEACKSKTVDTLYLSLILTSSSDIIKKMATIIIDAFSIFVPSFQLSAIKKTLETAFYKCTGEALILCNKILSIYKKLSLIKDTSKEQGMAKLEWLFTAILIQTSPPTRQSILESPQFQSLIFSPTIANNARNVALNIIEYFAKNGDESTKTTIHSLIVKHLPNCSIKKDEIETQFVRLCEQKKFTTKEEIRNIIYLNTILSMYDDYHSSLNRITEILNTLYQDNEICSKPKTTSVTNLKK